MSGVVKEIRTERFLEMNGVDSRFSLAFIEALTQHLSAIKWFITSRAVDGMWIGGSRLILDGDSKPNWRPLFALLAVLLATPLGVGSPRGWLAFLTARFVRLRVF